MGRPASCHCGTCTKCRRREYMRRSGAPDTPRYATESDIPALLGEVERERNLRDAWYQRCHEAEAEARRQRMRAEKAEAAIAKDALGESVEPMTDERIAAIFEKVADITVDGVSIIAPLLARVRAETARAERVERTLDTVWRARARERDRAEKAEAERDEAADLLDQALRRAHEAEARAEKAAAAIADVIDDARMASRPRRPGDGPFDVGMRLQAKDTLRVLARHGYRGSTDG